MDAEPWIKLLHELGIIIAAISGAIAATSSLKNGRTLKNGSMITVARKGKLRVKPKKTSNVAEREDRDWFKPPKL